MIDEKKHLPALLELGQTIVSDGADLNELASFFLGVGLGAAHGSGIPRERMQHVFDRVWSDLERASATPQ